MKLQYFAPLACFAIAGFPATTASAALKIASIFSDHVVLQCGRPVTIWGSADAGANVVVEFAGQKKTATAGADGTWAATLDALRAGAEPRELRVSAGQDSLTIQDVLVGEVWHASGQSNMAWTVGDVARQFAPVKEQAAAARFPAIRFRRINDGESATPLTELRGKGGWTVCSPATVSGFSAAAYFFARRLHEDLGVPVAVIDTSRGGSPIEPYIPRSAFDSHPTLQRELELGDKQDLAGLRALAGGVYARDAHWLPGRLFHSRLAPIARFSARGALWYQGESNCGVGEDPRDYQHKMRALIKGWRRAFANDELPVYFVQLPGSGAGAHWPYLREEQRRSLDVARTGMVVTVDLEGGGIHPPNKVDVGERLARWALAKEYGRQVPFSGPTFVKAEIGGGRITVHFDHAEKGLMIAAKSGLEAPRETPEASLKMFEVADEAGAWFPAEAKISGGTIAVSSSKVERPVAVRYAYRITPKGCNLYNREGLPASPFCSRPELSPFDAKLPVDE